MSDLENIAKLKEENERLKSFVLHVSDLYVQLGKLLEEYAELTDAEEKNASPEQVRKLLKKYSQLSEQ